MQPNLTTRRGLRVLAILFVVASLLVAAVFATSAFASPVTPPNAAKQGARWMSEQIIANNGFLTSFGSPDPVNTAYAVIGLRAAHVGAPASDAAIAYLKTQLGSPLQLNGTDAPGQIAYYVMAAVAAGEDPAHFGGTGAANDLVARLLATQRTTGPDAGLFGVQDPSFDGAFRQGLALAALKAAKTPLANLSVIEGIAWLAHQQCANGLWQAYRSTTATPCDPADPNQFTGPDTNSTALAMQGLAAYAQRPMQATAVASLHAVQSADGGFPYIAAAGQSSDPNSTAVVIQGLVADQQHPAKPEWSKPGGTPFSALIGDQLNCTDPAPNRGAFFYPGFGRDPNTFATVQAIPALVQHKLPLPKVVTMNAPPAPIACAS
jgi:hypothetical protein